MHRYDSFRDHHICFDFSTAPVFFPFLRHYIETPMTVWISNTADPIRFSDSHVFFRRVERFFIPLLFN